MAGTAAATTTVCSMCGDVGFPEKLFRYCTNYYGDSAPASADSDMCDWCLSVVAGKARSPAGKQNATGSQESSTTTGSGGSGRGAAGKAEAGRRATTRPAGRRYKLLKDV
ncbi:Zinc ion binding protein [Zea mays]|uniref:Zinc ion binding protein n=1 Tax=Zea mays TaxID=4577 RepID=A0A1D6E415_MAIZE|nr:Zinc ion binding protein [Zea mays]